MPPGDDGEDPRTDFDVSSAGRELDPHPLVCSMDNDAAPELPSAAYQLKTDVPTVQMLDGGYRGKQDEGGELQRSATQARQASCAAATPTASERSIPMSAVRALRHHRLPDRKQVNSVSMAQGCRQSDGVVSYAAHYRDTSQA